MIVALAILTSLLSASLVLISFVQLLYLESLRLRAREMPSVAFFKETLQDRLGLDPDPGSLAFSLLKHCSMILLGIMVLGISLAGGPLNLAALVEACVMGLGAMAADHLRTAAAPLPAVARRVGPCRWSRYCD